MRQISIVLLLSCQWAWSCSTFSYESQGSRWVGKAFEWMDDAGYVWVNPRDVKKTAMVWGKETPAQWIAKFGSTTFSPAGRELPVGGINEAGLVAESLWLEETLYPTTGNKPAIHELQWLQYQLDNYSTVSEVIKHLEDLSIVRWIAPLQYYFCDKTGDCAAIAFIKGKPTLSNSTQMKKSPILTNHHYQELLSAQAKQERTSGKLPPIPPEKVPDITGKVTSVERFLHGSAALSQFKEKGALRAWSVMNRIDTGDYTKWKIAYNLTDGKVYFRTLKFKNPVVVDTKKLNYECVEKVLSLRMDEKAPSSDGLRWLKTAEKTESAKAVHQAFRNFISEMAPGSVEKAARYPESLKCQKTGRG